MKMSKRSYRTRMLAWLGVGVMAGSVLAGCSPAPQQNGPATEAETATPATEVKITPVTLPTPKEPQPAPASEPPVAATAPAETAAPAVMPAATAPAADVTPTAPIQKRPPRDKDIFAINGRIQDLEKSKGKGKEESKKALAALYKQRDELIAELKPRPAIEGLVDFVDFSFRKDKNGDYAARWYFIVKEDVKEEWILSLTGQVDPSHVKELPEKDQEVAATVWRLRPRTTDIKDWKKGEHRVIKAELNDVRLIPYDMTSQFYQWSEDKPRVNGKALKHGWQAPDVEEPAATEPAAETK